MDTLRKTPLTEWHRAHGAKMAPFAGFDMPVQYEGIMIEHKHTRTAAGVFDISHMGEFRLEGSGAKDALNKVVTHNLDTLGVGKCRYGFLLNDEGGVVDDLIIYRLAEDGYMLVVNGACETKDFEWIAKHLPAGLELVNISDATAKIDLQGPQALGVLETALGADWKHLKYFNFEQTSFEDEPIIVSRTGYTGELGYEFYLPAAKAAALWAKLVTDERVKPVGLGARDTLRLECGYPLYGQDLDEKHTPREAGYAFLLGKEGEFVGKAGLGRVDEVLVPLTIEGRRTARTHDEVLDADGKRIGEVTSGSFAPTLGHCLALAYVKADAADAATFTIKTARAELEAKKSELPFFKDGTARMKVDA